MWRRICTWCTANRSWTLCWIATDATTMRNTCSARRSIGWIVLRRFPCVIIVAIHTTATEIFIFIQSDFNKILILVFLPCSRCRFSHFSWSARACLISGCSPAVSCFLPIQRFLHGRRIISCVGRSWSLGVRRNRSSVRASADWRSGMHKRSVLIVSWSCRWVRRVIWSHVRGLSTWSVRLKLNFMR